MNAQLHAALRSAALPLVVATCFALGACTQSTSPTQAPATASSTTSPATDAQVAQKLVLYRSMLAARRDDLAAPIGQEIVNSFPHTAAAAEVRKTLAQVQTRAQANAETERLAALWLYRTAMMEGAMQHTASLTTSRPSGADRVQLILRRHAKWGQSVYLFGSGSGFACKAVCNLPMRFDGKQENWKAYLPETGEPALFIKDDTRFIAALHHARRIEMDATFKDGRTQTLLFEVAGFDPTKWPPLSKH